MTAPTYAPSPQQEDIVSMFATGAPMVIEAGAGCGKTSSIVDCADRLWVDRPAARGVYITLNSDVAKEVGSRFTKGNILSSTIHSLALRMLSALGTVPFDVAIPGELEPLRGYDLAQVAHNRMRVPSGQYKPWEYAGLLGVHEGVVYTPRGTTAPKMSCHPEAYGKPKGYKLPSTERFLTPTMILNAGKEVVENFCSSDAPELDLGFALGVIRSRPTWMVPDKLRRPLAEIILAAARNVWDDARRPVGFLPFSHSWYLKWWSLLAPDIKATLGLAPGSVLFFDEAQDSRPCISRVVFAQMNYADPVQVVCVGDTSQAIYGFSGAVDALDTFALAPGVEVLPLSVSWRFGQEIADEANKVLSVLGADLRITGNPSKTSTVGIDTGDLQDYDAVICRTNAQVLGHAMEAISEGIKVSATINVKEIKNTAQSLLDLAEGRKPSHPDLKMLNGPGEVARYLNEATGGDSLARLLVQCMTPKFTREPWTAEMVRECAQSGVPEIVSTLDNLVSDDEADLIISTIHKAKGRQWPRVLVSMDRAQVFGIEGDTPPSPSMLMLLYVAITRGEEVSHYVDPELRYQINELAE